MTQNEKAVIQAVVRTLDSLTVTGRDNMSRLLGCIGALEELPEADTEAKEAEHG